MNNNVVYFVSMGFVGAVLAAFGLWESLTEGITLSSGLLTAGGVVLLVGTVLQWVDFSSPDPGWKTWVAVVGALLVVLGSLALLFL